MLATFKALPVRLLYWANDAFPNAKSLVPKSLLRFLLLRIVGMNKVYEEMLRINPERLFLEHEALPWVRDHYEQVLFVGTAPYTYHYETLFRDDPDRYTTIDHNPSARVWGSKHHITAPIQEVDRHRPAGCFDCVVLNGVLFYELHELGDYGIVGLEELRKLVGALHRVMRPGGLLLVGWNQRDMSKSPSELGILDSCFEPTESPWGRRKEFAGDPHVFEFYERSGHGPLNDHS